MPRAWINIESIHSSRTKSISWQHAKDGLFENLIRERLEESIDFVGTNATWIACMVVISLVESLVARESNGLDVLDNDIVTTVR